MRDKLRITGGERRGRKLYSPPTGTIRPASDMIRQAVFNMLQGEIAGTTFFDIFAGTGIVGMEALSRGARQAIFVELDRNQIALIHRNLHLTQMATRAQVRRADALAWGRYFVPPSGPVIVFLGPPYPLFDPDPKQMLDLVANVQKKLRSGDILVFQFPRELPEESLPGDEWHRIRKYGKTKVGIWRHPSDRSALEADDSDSADEEE